MSPSIDKTSRPIGVFDSGVGGLTVVRAIRSRLPDEEILYFGDTARVPYGTKSPETIRRYTREISSFLNNQGVKCVVVACNSCSATALDCVTDCFEGPVIGVIEPGSRKALSVTRNGRVGVIGTQATVDSGAYERTLRGFSPEVQVFSTACPLFVPLAEERMDGRQAARLIAEEYLHPLLEQSIDTLILGCTHYPLLKETIQSVVGEDITIVDSAETTAEGVFETLRELEELESSKKEARIQTYVSDNPQGVEKFCRFLMPDERIWVGTAQPSMISSEVKG
ncbi:MAG: glutamate racemase [Candidatus Omnitrophica bacterium]|nr:glutamate racemase [Candidatus Omnitrophota bacterium]